MEYRQHRYLFSVLDDFLNVPRHFCVVIFFLSRHIPAVARGRKKKKKKRRGSRSSTKLHVHSPARLFVRTNDKLKVFDTCVAIPTCTALHCCYTWLCFTTWICVFYVLTSGCVYSIWPAPPPSVYAFNTSPLYNELHSINDGWKLQPVVRGIHFRAEGVSLHRRCARAALPVLKVRGNGENKTTTCT